RMNCSHGNKRGRRDENSAKTAFFEERGRCDRVAAVGFNGYSPRLWGRTLGTPEADGLYRGPVWV
ncbi:MAG: hypothetical protein ACK47R_25755, partial [Planctomycetia bacterium]